MESDVIETFEHWIERPVPRSQGIAGEFTSLVTIIFCVVLFFRWWAVEAFKMSV